MKRLFAVFLLLICCISNVIGQQSPGKSRTSSEYTYIYKLTDQETYELAAKPDLRPEARMLHTLLDSFRHDLHMKYPKQLPYGNYVYVKAERNQFNYELHAVQNVKIDFINDRDDFRFIVRDMNGQLIENAQVLQGGRKKLNFDPVSHAYTGNLSSRNHILSIVHDGIYNCVSYYYPKFYRRNIKKPRQVQDEEDLSNKYTGQLIFNKPKYKPLDTVKFKTYLLTKKGKPLDVPLKVELSSYEKPKATIGIFKPYRPGGYEGNFVLSDSMKLVLDRSYQVEMKIQHKNKWVTVYSGDIRYEDYELNSMTFAVRSDRTLLHPDRPATFYLKATDDNGLSVPDGRVSVRLTTRHVSKWFDQTNFVRSVLWTKDLVLDPSGETRLVLPDSIFPKLNMNVEAQFTFRNSNNETREAERSLQYDYENIRLSSRLGADSVYLSLLRNGNAQSQTAILYTSRRNSDKNDSSRVNFPLRLKIDPNVTNYMAKLPNGQEYLSDYPQQEPDFKLNAEHRKDSLKVQVSSVQHLPFWYTLFANDKAIKRGYTTSLDTIMAFKENDVAEISADYLWQGRMYHQQRRGFYGKQELKVELAAPAAVSPGQTVQMDVKVTDIASKPVANTDITAYAFTAKFREDEDLYPLTIGSAYRFRTHKNLPSNPLPLEKLGSIPLEWSKWHYKFGLDNIAYYQLSYPDELYIGQESINSEDAVVVPLAIAEGEIDPAYAVYIDGQPVYYINADQLRHYAFKVSPGPHKIELLTFNRHITLEYNFKKGFKTVLGIAADPSNTKAIVRKMGALDFTRRQQELQNHLLYISDNFEGNKALLTGGATDMLLNPPPATQPRKILRVGPLKEKKLTFESGELRIPFTWEPGKIYTFLTTGVETSVLDSANNRISYSNSSPEARTYHQNPLIRKEIDSIWNDFQDLASRSRNFSGNSKPEGTRTGQFQINLDTSITNMQQYLKNVIIYKKGDTSFKQVYGGATLYFRPLDEGLYRMVFLFRNNSYFILDNHSIKGEGINYLLLKRRQLHPADAMSKELDRSIKEQTMAKPGIHAYDYRIPATAVFPDVFKNETLLIRMSGTVLDAATLETLPNANIYYQKTSKDAPRPIRATNSKGFFNLLLPKSGILTFAFIGYDSKTVKIHENTNLRILMSESRGELENVVIRGYQQNNDRVVLRDVRTKKGNYLPVANIEQLLQGKVAGINIHQNDGAPGLQGPVNIRGLSTISTTGAGEGTGKKPLMIVDGKPYNGGLEDIDPTAIMSIEILSDAKAQALYGELGKNGVVLIKTNGTQHFGTEEENTAQQQTMRVNFSDAAFWQPKLLTDKEGKASFQVKFPDDITNWNTRVYAVNDRKQSGYFKMFIPSFKSLSASLTAPQFAVAGDQISLIGKLMNHHDKEERMVRSFEYNGKELLKGNLAFKNAHIDTLSITAPSTGDSLRFQYTLKQDSGYFDGELRKIPLLAKGLTETRGYFHALNSDTSITCRFDPALGKVTLHAEASIFPVLLNEIDKLRKYEYLCNEQVASKLKALLLEQKLRKYLNEDFKGEKDIRQLIKKLQSSKTSLGTWGWWQDSETEIWISGHVVEALVMARQTGFDVELNTAGLISYLSGQLNARKNIDQLFSARLMKTIDNQYNLSDWISSAERQLKAEKAPSLYQSLLLMRLKQQAGQVVDVSWLLRQKKSTLFGNSYWGEPGSNFWDNSIQNTLLAYQILKANGGYSAELDKIVRYFLEQRKDGAWRNTYESSLILETILPEILSGGKKPGPAEITLNGIENVHTFPFSKVIEPTQLSIVKKGGTPVYLTAYQQFLNPNPEKAGKDFTVKSTFFQYDKETISLKGGVNADLKVEVEVLGDADYVLIEVPIPAGCSYGNKPQSYWGVETHREYFKHKTSIFCSKLKQGKYTFTIQLMPRYSGTYQLNPAKAEMMYFPVFSGREGMKKISIH